MIIHKLYKNKITALDSISVKWEQFSTSKEYSYIKYQSNLKTKSVDKRPKADKEIIESFKWFSVYWINSQCFVKFLFENHIKL